MKQRKWKRLCTFLSLALMLTALCTLFVGYYRANAAVTNLTLAFGDGNGDEYFNASNSDQTSYRTDRTSGWLNSATNTTVNDVPRTQYTMPANESDLNLCYDLPTANQVTVGVNDIIYIQYTVVGLTTDNTTPTVWLFYTDGTNAQLDFTYRSGNNLRDSYAIVNKAGSVKSIRLDIPANGSSSTEFYIYVGKIYIGPSSGSPVKYTVQYKDAAGKMLDSQSLGYNATPSYSGSTPTKATVSKQYQYAFKDTWKDATNNSTGLTLSNQRITGNTVYEAEYKVSKVYITFKGRNPSDGTENYVLQEGWVNYNAIPTAPSLSTITAGDYM
ncbi:MAG: hypothetical protein IKM59_07890, partial [Oscillospiraceae bacterium]|nr:hypothetical protein [Oscillospiraceae bacterium]